MKRALLLSAVALSLAGRLQTTTSQRMHQDPVFVHTASAASLWEIRTESGLAGWVVYFHSERDSAESFYSVRNEWHQELGVVTSLGVAWKYHPHSVDAEHVATGTLKDGVVAILDTPESTELFERPVTDLASAYGPLPAGQPARAREAASSN